MSNTDLDFLDNFDIDETVDPTVNTAPYWKRKITGFFAGKAEIADVKWKADRSFFEMSFLVPEDSSGNDVIQVSFKLPAANFPAGKFIAKTGTPVKAIRTLLGKPSQKAADAVLKAMRGKDVYLVQVPTQRYPRQEAYTPTGWDGLCATYGGSAPTAEAMGVGGTDTDDDDLY